MFVLKWYSPSPNLNHKDKKSAGMHRTDQDENGQGFRVIVLLMLRKPQSGQSALNTAYKFT